MQPVNREFTGPGVASPNECEILMANTPDVRDGLTRTERIILYVLRQTERELGGRNVPTVMLYGRVVEYVNISEAEFQVHLKRLGLSSKQS